MDNRFGKGSFVVEDFHDTDNDVMRSMDPFVIFQTENSRGSAISIVASSTHSPMLQGLTSGQALSSLFFVAVTSTHIMLARWVQTDSLQTFHVFVPAIITSSPAGSGGCTRVVSRGKYFVDRGKLGSHFADVSVALKNGTFTFSPGSKTETFSSLVDGSPFRLAGSENSNRARCFGIFQFTRPADIVRKMQCNGMETFGG